jgi:hypothetical protein
MCNFEPVRSKPNELKDARFNQYITIRIAPFAAIWFRCAKRKPAAKTKQ